MNHASLLFILSIHIFLIVSQTKNIFAYITHKEIPQSSITHRLNLHSLDTTSAVATFPIKKPNKPKIRVSSKDSIRKARYKEILIQEAWTTFNHYVKADLDTSSILPYQHPFAHGSKRKALLDAVMPWIGTRYGSKISKGERSLDCSLFTAIIMQHVLGIQLLHGSSSIARQVNKLRSIKSIFFGDLVFFTGSNLSSKRVGHVGMYIANGVFVHASIQKGVIFSHWNEPYYDKRFLFAGTVRL